MTNTQVEPSTTLQAEAMARQYTGPVEDGQLFIGGAWTPAADERRREVVDPSTGGRGRTVAEADAADVDAAVAAARAAFDDGPWRSMSGRERARVLHRVADLIRENADELVRLESLDVGKPISLCRPST